MSLPSSDPYPVADALAQLLAEIEQGQGLTLGAAGRVLGDIDPSTVFRFIKRGSKSEAGEIVRLGAARIGSRWRTTRPAIARFMRQLTAMVEPIAASGRPAAPKKSNAAAKLRALGC